jgi:hypothetical protein
MYRYKNNVTVSEAVICKISTYSRKFNSLVRKKECEHIIFSSQITSHIYPATGLVSILPPTYYFVFNISVNTVNNGTVFTRGNNKYSLRQNMT